MIEWAKTISCYCPFKEKVEGEGEGKGGGEDIEEQHGDIQFPVVGAGRHRTKGKSFGLFL